MRCDSVSEFSEHGTGAFMWTRGSHPRLVIAIHWNGAPGFEVVGLNVDGWGFPGGEHKLENGSDDDWYDRPTITGSIPGADWHGWLREGRLTTQAP